MIAATDSVLNKVAERVAVKDIKSAEIQGLIDQMQALAAGRGHDKSDTRQMVGLAAPQLGVSKRVVTIDVTATGAVKAQSLKAFINPRIIKRSRKKVLGREGWSLKLAPLVKAGASYVSQLGY